jgi:peptide/nickel transport system substrate-binding protein
MIRKRTSRLLLAPTVLVVGAMAVTACSAGDTGNGPTGDEPAAIEGGTLTIYTTAEDVSFDPASSQNLAITTLGLNARRLTTWKVSPDAATEVVPDLATDTGTPSDDGKTWTFTLKDGLAFEDGTPITSEAVKYGLERSFATELSGGLTYHKAVLEGA